MKRKTIYISFQKISQNASLDGYIAVLITLLKRFSQTNKEIIRIFAQMPELNEKVNFSRQKISLSFKLSLWTFGKNFLQHCWKIPSLMSEYFSAKCRKFEKSLIFFSKKNMFLQNVTLNTYRVVLTTRLKTFDQKVKKIKSYNICTKHESLRKKFLRRNSISFFKKLQSISKKSPRNLSNANISKLARGFLKLTN